MSLIDLFMYFSEVLDTIKSDPEAIKVLEAKHWVLYVYSIFIHLKYFLTLFFNFTNYIDF